MDNLTLGIGLSSSEALDGSPGRSPGVMNSEERGPVFLNVSQICESREKARTDENE